MDGGEIEGNRGNLLVGSQEEGDVAGLIMNGGSIYAATLAFGEAEGVIYTNDGSLGTAINSVIIGSGGLTTFGPGALVLGDDNTSTLSGAINVNSGMLILRGAGS